MTVAKPLDVEVVVLGAGFSGVCAAIQLKRRGIGPFVVLEKADDVGGTWRENTYPGAECDVPSHIYSYSFAPKPDWSKHYAAGAEIWEYIRKCVKDFGVSKHIRFNSHVSRAVWTGEVWEVSTLDGAVYRARSVISALGGLHTPSYPQLPGLNSFRGVSFHTSKWDHSVNLQGRRIAMIGTGATAVQAAPTLAQAGQDFYLFQRTPSWVGPKVDPVYTVEQKGEFANNPDALRRHRWELWRQWESTTQDLFTAGTALNQLIEKRAVENIRDHVDSPDLIARLTPEYNITCKRPTISNQYYPIFNQPNVHLITEAVEAVTPEGVRLRSGEQIGLDVIVCATGFKPFDITTELEFVGVGGVNLADAWSTGITTYRTVMVHGFPNLFLLLGPNTAGLNSALQMIEAGTKYALDVISGLNGSGAGLHPRRQQVDAFTEQIAEMSRYATANHGCTSWWTANGNHALWPGSSVTYRLMLSHVDLTHLQVAEA